MVQILPAVWLLLHSQSTGRALDTVEEVAAAVVEEGAEAVAAATAKDAAEAAVAMTVLRPLLAARVAPSEAAVPPTRPSRSHSCLHLRLWLAAHHRRH